MLDTKNRSHAKAERKTEREPARRVPQTAEEAERWLSRLDTLLTKIDAQDKQLERRNARAREIIARRTERAAQERAPLMQELQGLADGILAYAQANQDALTRDGRKLVEFGNHCGFRWTDTPESVTIADEKGLLAFLKKHIRKFRKFLRIKYEINKQAMLANEKNKEQARKLPGVTIGSRTKFAILAAGTDTRLERTLGEPDWETVQPKPK